MMLLSLLAVVFSLVQEPVRGASVDTEKTLERLEAEWNGAHVRGDATTLDRLFGDDLGRGSRHARDGEV